MHPRLSPLLAALCLVACGDDSSGMVSATDGATGTSESCVDGYEGCPCTADGLCLGGLACVDQVCAQDPSSGGESESNSGSMSASAGSSTSETGSSSTSDATATSGSTASTGDVTATDSGSTTGAMTEGSTDGTGSSRGSDSDSDSDSTSEGSGTDSTGGDPVCGDDQVQDGEECDGIDLDGQSCVGLGYKGGKLSCSVDCTLDDGMCTDSLACGDGLIVPGVLCYKPPVKISTSFTVWLATGDFDEDGHLDVVGGAVQGGLRLFLGDGEGGLAPTASDMIDVAPRVVLDLDHDDHLDVIGDRYGDKIGVAYGDGLGGFTMGETYDTFDSVTSVALGDVNADGWDDLAVGNAGNINKVTFRLGKPGGLFGPQVSYASPKDAYVVGFRDIDHDDKTDLWAFTGWGDFLVYKGDGDGGFSLQPDQPQLPASAPRYALVDHFNGDDHYDIALFDNAGGNLHVRLGEAMGYSDMLYSYQVDDIFPFTGVAGNFDGDDDLDLAGLTNSDVLDVFRGDGTGLFYDGVNLKPGLYGRAVTVGDLNEDGIDDFITSHAYTLTKHVSIQVTLSDP